LERIINLLEEGFMKRTLLIVAGILTTLELLMFDQQLSASIERLSHINPSPQMVLAADPALKYISEDSPYMSGRNEGDAGHLRLWYEVKIGIESFCPNDQMPNSANFVTVPRGCPLGGFLIGSALFQGAFEVRRFWRPLPSAARSLVPDPIQCRA
jgi:hypothetical protein